MSWREESWPKKPSAENVPAQRAGTSAPLVLCAGIIVLDKVFRVEKVPQPDSKVEAKDFFIVSGGCAANAAITVARLGGRAALAGPLGGPAGEDGNGDLVLAALAREHVDCSACQRIDGLATGLSAIFIDSRGDRTIVTYRDQRIAAVMPGDADSVVAAADLVLADNRYPQYVRPICEAARHRKLRIVLDADKATVEDDVLFRIASHIVFSAECLRATTGRGDLTEGLAVIAQQTDAFLAVSDGPNDILFLEACCATCRCSPSARWIRSVPATPCMPDSHWRWPKDITKPTRCGSVPRSPASSAPASAAPPARRCGPRSRRSWPNVAWHSPPDASTAEWRLP